MGLQVQYGSAAQCVALLLDEGEERVLSDDEARMLAEVRAGSEMGELLRRYWMPIAAESELDERAVRPVRVLGEDFVLFRDGGGTLGLVERHCPHRGFDLAFATPEAHGLRCNYHGWRFDETGRCVERPYEEAVNVASCPPSRAHARAQPVQAKAGLVWAYLGPEPAPLLPDWAGFYSPGYSVVSFLRVPCHWLQIMEGFYDPVHVEWLHDRWSYVLNGRPVPERRPAHTDFRWLDFEHGVVFQRKLGKSDDWLADRTVLFPNVDAAGGQGSYMTWVIPVDETHSLLAYRLTITSWKSQLGQVMVPAARGAPQGRVPAYRVDASLDAQAGAPAHFGSHLVSQDYASWLGPGPFADRTRECLGATDRGVVMFRKRLIEQARVVAEGGDPQGVLRDAEANHRLVLPGARKGYGERGEGLPGLSGEDDVMWRAFLPVGVPKEIKNEVEQAMAQLVEGLRPDWWKR